MLISQIRDLGQRDRESKKKEASRSNVPCTSMYPTECKAEYTLWHIVANMLHTCNKEAFSEGFILLSITASGTKFLMIHQFSCDRRKNVRGTHDAENVTKTFYIDIIVCICVCVPYTDGSCTLGSTCPYVCMHAYTSA